MRQRHTGRPVSRELLQYAADHYMSEPVESLEIAPAPPVPAPPPVGNRRLMAALEVLLCCGVPTQITIAALLALAGWTPADAQGRTQVPFILTVLFADTIAVIGLMVMLMRAHGESPRALWIGQRSVVRETLLGLGLVPSVFLLVVVLLNTLRLIAPWLHNVPVNPLEEMAGRSSVNAAIFGLAAILAGGVREELQRAFLLRRFEQHLGGAAVGTIVLSVAFGVAHFEQGYDAIITTGVLGLIWALIYLRRRSSLAPIVSHAGFNSLEVLRVALTGG